MPVAGRFKYQHQSPEDYPAVGDWVLFSLDGAGSARIHYVLPRRTAFVRKVAGRTSDLQVVASNVDVVFLMMARVDTS